MVSFIIPAYNEERLLPATLEAIRAAARALGLKDVSGEAPLGLDARLTASPGAAATHAPFDPPDPATRFEIIVADDASTDSTAALATRSGARVVTAGQRKISAARNAGARAARGDFLIFVDADTLVDARVIGAALEALRRGAVGGGAALRFDGRMPWFAHVLDFFIGGLARLLNLAYGCFLFARREDFEAVGGFDERLFAAEEWALSRALQKRGRGLRRSAAPRDEKDQGHHGGAGDRPHNHGFGRTFVMLREPVVTSGRKLRAYSAWEVFKTFLAIAATGPWGLRSRRAKSIWYGPRREDPG